MNKKTNPEDLYKITILDIRDPDLAHPTGIVATASEWDALVTAFEDFRPYGNPAGGFLVDLYLEFDLVDTIQVGRETVEQLTGKQLPRA